MRVLPFLLLLLILPARAQSDETDVSLVQLITHPDHYHGKRVRLIGYMHLEFEGDALYMHRDDYAYVIYKNGLALELTSSQRASAAKISDRYVTVEGTFNGKQGGYGGAFSGSIGGVTRLADWSAAVKRLRQQQRK